MAFISISAALVVISQFLQARWGGVAVLVRRRIPCQAVWFGAALLPLGFAAQLRVVDYASRYDQLTSQTWLARLPMRLAFPGPAPGTIPHANMALGIVTSVIVQSLGLLMLSFGKPDRYNRIAPVIAGVALAMLSISASVLTSSDVFFYAYTSTLGLDAYNGEPVSLNSPYHFLLPNVPLTGSIYGPLWTEFNAFTASFGTTLYEKIIVLRIASAGFLVLAALLVRNLNLPRRAQIAFVLNPMLWFYFVVNAHNDLLAIALCLSAIAIVRRHPRFAVALIATAGAVKISFLVIGCCVFARLRSRAKILFASIASVLFSLLISWIVGGNRYFGNLLGYAHGRNAGRAPDVQVLAAAMATCALLVIGSTVLTRRIYPAVAWIFPLAAPLAFPWYLVWGLPYAIVVRRGFAATLLLLPIGAALGDQAFGLETLASLVLYSVFILVTTTVIYRSVQRRRNMRLAT